MVMQRYEKVEASASKAAYLSYGPLQEGETKSFIAIILGIFTFIHLLLALYGPMNIMGGELVGNDGYTRLNRVQFVYEHGTWNASIFPRSNAPYGESIHWTKPMDIILLAGGILFSGFVSFSKGLHAWGVIISPLLHIVAFLGLFCLMRKRFDRLGLLLLLALFLLQPFLFSYFMVGRPDHHSLLLAIFSWFVVGMHWGFEIKQRRNDLIFLGCLGALGLWVSVEFLAPIGFFLAVYTMVWIVKGTTKHYPILIIMGSLFVFSIFFLLMERFGENHFLVEYDRISLPHVMVMGLIFVVWSVIAFFSQKTMFVSTLWGRIALLGVGSLIAVWCQWMMFPEFFYGPLAEMDPAIRMLVWNQIAETQPLGSLFPLQVGDVITSLGVCILIIPFLLKRLRNNIVPVDFDRTILLLVGMAIFIPLAIFERRWTPYASILLILPYAEFIRNTLVKIGRRWPRKKEESNVMPLTLGFLLVFWPVVIGPMVALGETKARPKLGKTCHLKPLTQFLADRGNRQGSPKTILAYKDFGPEILYCTSHRVLGTPMHRNLEGFKDSLAIMKAQNFEMAKAMIQHRHIDLILICPNSPMEFGTYADSSASKENFYTRLVEGAIPPWLNEIVLPSKLRESFRLFEVRSNNN